MSKHISELKSIIGKENIITDPNILKFYSSDKSSFESESSPFLVLKPKNVREIQSIITYSNKHNIPITPCSSKIHFYGRTIPVQGGLVIDLSKMNNIVKIDSRNKNITIEPGVSYSQLNIIKEKGLMPLLPLCPPENKSVITSYLEREPLLIPKLEYYEPILTMEVVLPTGEILRTGSAALMPSKFAEYVVPFGPGLNWNQIFQGAQGTFGIITRATIKIEFLPLRNKLYFFTSDNLEDLIEPLYEVQRNLLGNECLILNNLNLSLIGEIDASDFTYLKQKLSQWTFILCLTGGMQFPDDKIKQEEEDLMDSLKQFNIRPSIKLNGFENRILQVLRESYGGIYWKLKKEKDFQDIIFITTLNKTPEFVALVKEIISKQNYFKDDIGCYIQPLVRGGACQIEFTLFYDNSDSQKKKVVKKTYEDIIENVLEMGAFFSRPYGTYLSKMIYKRNLSYSHVLKEIKAIFDPNNIMNPHKLCFDGRDKNDP